MSATTLHHDAPVLRAPKNAVERRMIGLWMLYGVLMSATIAVAPVIVSRFWDVVQAWVIPAFVLAGAVLIVTAFIEPFWRFRVHRWETTEHAVYARSGWLVRQWRVAPLSRIQTVDSTQGPLERIFGLATLTVTTASSGGAITIVGLDHELASRVSDELTQIVQITPGDAT